jgi:hypothetical protein
MKSYKFKGVLEYGSPRCPVINTQDASTLVGYCYGRFALSRLSDSQASTLEISEYTRDLLLALFSCGAPIEEVFLISDMYIDSVIWTIEDNKLLNSISIEKLKIMLEESIWLNFLLDNFTDRSSLLIRIIDELLYVWKTTNNYEEEAQLELELYKAALSREAANFSCLKNTYRDFEFARVSVSRVLLNQDGDQLAKLVDEELRDLLPRSRRLTTGKRELFLDRTKVFRVFGWGFLFTGIRKLAAALGCQIPSPAIDTLVFYL